MGFYLPQELIRNIYQYSNLKDLQKIKKLNKQNNLYAHKLIFNYLMDMLPKHILKLLDNLNYKEIEYLPFKEKYIGYTNCIDQIKLEDLVKINPYKSIFIGITNDNRPFISFKIDVYFPKYYVEARNLLNKYPKCPYVIYKDKVKFTFVQTIFQRYLNKVIYNFNKSYTNQLTPWYSCSYYNLVDFTNTELNKNCLTILHFVINTKKFSKPIEFNVNGIMYDSLDFKKNNIKPGNFLKPINYEDLEFDHKKIFSLRLS